MSKEVPLIPSSESVQRIDAKTSQGRWQMLLLLGICAAPVIASYITFYIIKPEGSKTNYGQLIYPVQEVPESALKKEVYGKWTLLIARPAENCEASEQSCIRLLFLLRQVRASMGKERQRLQIVWLTMDGKEPNEKIKSGYDEEIAGLKTIRLSDDKIERKIILEWLNQNKSEDAIQLLDPNGARMMIYPVSENAPEFSKMRKDIEKLLKWNPTGKYGQ